MVSSERLANVFSLGAIPFDVVVPISDPHPNDMTECPLRRQGSRQLKDPIETRKRLRWALILQPGTHSPSRIADCKSHARSFTSSRFVGPLRRTQPCRPKLATQPERNLKAADISSGAAKIAG
jgi:hypothetical protein